MDEVKTAFTGLANQIKNHERRLSKEYKRFDLVIGIRGPYHLSGAAD
jgi:hypothetical protein